MKSNQSARLTVTILSYAGLWASTLQPTALAAPKLLTQPNLTQTAPSLTSGTGSARPLAQTNPLPSTQQSAELEEAERLNQQAVQLYQQGQYAAAIPLAERALEIQEKMLGTEHPDVATSLNNLAVLYWEMGNYSTAEPLYQRSLEILEKALGAEHPDVATSLNNLAELYRAMGNYAAAEPLLQHALAIWEKALGTEHPHVATSLNVLAELYRAMGNYAAAEPLLQRALAIQEKALGAEHPDIARSLNNLALLYSDMGNYAAAEPLLQRSLAMWEKALGAEHPSVATSLNNLASLYRAMGNYSAAEPLLQRSLAIQEKALGTEHPNIARSLNNLALLYKDMGNYSAVEPLYQRSLAIFEKALGTEHPHVATSLNNLAELYRAMGNYSAAEPLYQRSLALREKALGTEHPNIARSLNNLASLYREMGNYSAAEPLYQRSLAIFEKALGLEHPDVAASLNNLAGLYREMGNYAAAEPLYQRSFAIVEKALGTEHPSVAASLNNLAGLYREMGNYAAAEPLFQQALAILEKALGLEHPDVATSLNNLALLYQAQNNIPRATEFLQRATNVEENNLSLIFTTGSEPEKRAYTNTLAGTTHHTISLHLQAAPNNPEAARLALTTVLRRKGRILDALTESLNLLRQNFTPENQALLDQLAAKRTQLANLIYNQPENLPLEQYRRQVATLKTEAEKLESELSRRSAEFRVASEPVTIEAVQALIPVDTALVEIALYSPFDPRANQWGEPRYAAYILKSSSSPQWVDLGEAQPIDQAATEFRQGLLERAHPALARTPGRALDELLMQPIRAQLGNTQNILLSPDGKLNLIPFAALVDENQQYLLENYRITYLTTGRDLLRLAISSPSGQPPVMFANPDYDRSEGDATVSLLSPPSQQSERGVAQNRRSRDIEDLSFSPLPGTAKEAAAIAPLLDNVTLLVEAQATENALKQVRSPKILHLATHGFFLKVDRVAPPDNPFSFSDDSPLIAARPGAGATLLTPGQQENPLLRSGLALAGINVRQSGEEDGVLTALESAHLNLRGTQLVVLSACKTGLGEAADGEGVYGLRRALVIAGAESQAMSLWAVDDEETKNLMVKYYRGLLQGEGRSEALRQAQLEMLNSEDYFHPYYWAAFIPSGEWREME